MDINNATREQLLAEVKRLRATSHWANVATFAIFAVCLVFFYNVTLTAFVNEYDDDEFRDAWLLIGNIFLTALVIGGGKQALAVVGKLLGKDEQ